MVDPVVATKSAPARQDSRSPNVKRPLATKLKAMPALVETKLAATTPSEGCSSQKSVRSSAVLTTPTAAKRVAVRPLRTGPRAAPRAR